MVQPNEDPINTGYFYCSFFVIVVIITIKYLFSRTLRNTGKKIRFPAVTQKER